MDNYALCHGAFLKPSLTQLRVHISHHLPPCLPTFILSPQIAHFEAQAEMDSVLLHLIDLREFPAHFQAVLNLMFVKGLGSLQPGGVQMLNKTHRMQSGNAQISRLLEEKDTV